MLQPYIESVTALSDTYIYIFMDTNTDHFTPNALRVRDNKGLLEYWTCMLMVLKLTD